MPSSRANTDGQQAASAVRQLRSLEPRQEGDGGPAGTKHGTGSLESAETRMGLDMGSEKSGNQKVFCCHKYECTSQYLKIDK